MPSEIAVPFRLDGNGRVVAVTDPDAQVRQHVLALLHTIPEERAMVPGYGTDTSVLMFGDDNEEIATQFSIRAREAMQRFEPGVELLSVSAQAEDLDEGAKALNVEFRRLDAPDSSAVANANRAVIGVGGVVRDLVRG